MVIRSGMGQQIKMAKGIDDFLPCHYHEFQCTQLDWARDYEANEG